MNRLWTDEHAGLLRESAPDNTEATGAVERVWNRVSVVFDEVTPRPSRRRRRVAVASGLAAVALGASGVAVAGVLVAHTGKGPANAEDLALGGPGERLSLGGSDLKQVILEESHDIPFPSTAAREQVAERWNNDLKRWGPAQTVSAGYLREWLAIGSVCTWANEWAHSRSTGDEPRRREAIRQLQAAPTWPAVTAVDPAPYRRMAKLQQGQPTRADESEFYYLRRLISAVESDSPAKAARALRSQGWGCWAQDVPYLPGADLGQVEPQ